MTNTQRQITPNNILFKKNVFSKIELRHIQLKIFNNNIRFRTLENLPRKNIYN